MIPIPEAMAKSRQALRRNACARDSKGRAIARRPVRRGGNCGAGVPILSDRKMSSLLIRQLLSFVVVVLLSGRSYDALALSLHPI